MKVVQLEGSTRRLNAHSLEDCLGEVCCIHKMTDHSMRGFPQLWREDRRIMERICPHGVGHPDPDDVVNQDRLLPRTRRQLNAPRYT